MPRLWWWGQGTQTQRNHPFRGEVILQVTWGMSTLPLNPVSWPRSADGAQAAGPQNYGVDSWAPAGAGLWDPPPCGVLETDGTFWCLQLARALYFRTR